MGIIANTKGFLAQKAASAAEKAGNLVSDAAQLSTKQLAEIEDRREKYLDEMPKVDGEEIQAAVQKNLGAMGIEVYQDYLNKLGEIYEPYDSLTAGFNARNRIMYFDITKWVTDKEEKNLDKLVNVYHVLSEEDCNIALIYNRKPDGCRISMGVINTDDEKSDPSIVQALHKRVVEAVRGNFPGVEIKENQENMDTFGIGTPETLARAMEEKQNNSVAVVTNLPSEKSEDFISQSMEKLLDGIIPSKEEEEYTIVLLAKPIRNQLEKQNRLYELYSGLAPYAAWQTNFTYTESMAANSGANLGVNVGVSAGVQYSISNTLGKATPEKFKEEKLKEKEKTDGKWQHRGRMTLHQLAGAGARVLGWYAPTTKSESQAATNGVNAGANFGVSFSRSSSITAQLGKNEGITQSYTNYGVKHTLDIIEGQIKRIEQSSALGLWDFAAYVISKDPVVANNVAHMYVALTQGEESFVSRTSISLWDGSREEVRANADTILRSVCLLQHPLFKLKSDIADEWLMYPSLVTPTTSLSGTELAKALNFPRRSVTKFPVLESVSFGRDVQTFHDDIAAASENTESEQAEKIQIGSVYHMRKRENHNLVNLDLNSLASHVFITGSTGTGKSNAVYQLLDQLKENNVRFMVVEPAKGEYKEVFGGYGDVKVFGTNPQLTELLRTNPFSFPGAIHVLEHIDRLVEILNACWPMYAAMPAVLKDAIEQIYVNKGWNLLTSKSETGEFPTFADLLETLPDVMNQSMYSEDTKSDYSGALVTRVKSLTNGMNKQIFCSGSELDAGTLFENNVIVDLSRIGSVETKSLIMGILVMKLQEYRLDLHEMNAPLRHVTVLEEAHNILRKTSFAQSQESSNLQGKSVEMISNAIAEMRSFGEGFIIADQAPELLDESVIRNTNTKIILRLPDSMDRKTVGEAISLTDEQINELAKLPRGVAAVYQNDWLQAVLCSFECFPKDKKKPLKYVEEPVSEIYKKFVSGVFAEGKEKLDDHEIDVVARWIDSLTIGTDSKSLAKEAAKGKVLSERQKECLAYNLFGGRDIGKFLKSNNNNCEQSKKEAIERIAGRYDGDGDLVAEKIYQLILNAVVNDKENERNNREWVKVYTDLERERGYII